MGRSVLGWNDFSLTACGETFPNEDGGSRQDELRRCQPGETVYLKREPFNEHDHMAVAVLTCRQVKVGYLARDRAVWIGSKIDRGYDVRAIVHRIKGIDLEGASLRLLMRINMEGDDPELPVGTGGSIMADGASSQSAKKYSMVSTMVSR